jgi:type II secretory pathway predicted ATPase ExeA
MSDSERLDDPAREPDEARRAIDHELAEAEREMYDADEQLRLLHERQQKRKRRF